MSEPAAEEEPLLELCRGSKGMLSAPVNMLHECGTTVISFTHA